MLGAGQIFDSNVVRPPCGYVTRASTHHPNHAQAECTTANFDPGERPRWISCGDDDANDDEGANCNCKPPGPESVVFKTSAADCGKQGGTCVAGDGGGPQHR